MPSAASAAAISSIECAGGAQRQHPGPERAGGLARPFRAGLGLGEEVELAGAQQGGHLMHAWRWSSRTGRRPRRRTASLDEVGAQRLVAALAAPAGSVKNSAPGLNWIPSATCIYDRAAFQHGQRDAPGYLAVRQLITFL